MQVAEAYGGPEIGNEPLAQDESFLAHHVIPAASAAIRRYTGRDFTATAYSEYFDLNQWSPNLILGHYPVTSVSRVTLYPYDRTAIEEIDGAEYIVGGVGEIRLRPDSTATALFPPGFQSVRVEYTAGGEVPADVQWACGRLVSGMLSAMLREPGLVMERHDGSTRHWATIGLNAIPSNPEIKAMLDPFVNGRIATTSTGCW